MTKKAKTTRQVEREVLLILHPLQDALYEDKFLDPPTGYHLVSDHNWTLIKEFVQKNTPWTGLIGDH